MKEKNWYELNGWYWDKRDHMWKRKVMGEKSAISGEVSTAIKRGASDSKPFTKKHNTLILNNIPYPLKFHEVMYKK